MSAPPCSDPREVQGADAGPQLAPQLEEAALPEDQMSVRRGWEDGAVSREPPHTSLLTMTLHWAVASGSYYEVGDVCKRIDEVKVQTSFLNQRSCEIRSRLLTSCRPSIR